MREREGIDDEPTNGKDEKRGRMLGRKRNRR